MLVDYARESVAEVRDEIGPLLENHWREVAFYQDIPLSPDWPAYEKADATGFLRVYTARMVGVLIGYCVVFVRQGLHYTTSTEAAEDILFIAPQFRKGRIGIGLIKFTDDQLRAEGVQLIKRHVKLDPALNFGPLLERMGYEPIDQIFGKRLDRN